MDTSSWFWAVLLYVQAPHILAQTKGGNGEGDPCAFPFIYKAAMHTTCITADHNKLWCSTTPNYDKHGKWGECEAEDFENLPVFDLSTKQNVTVNEGEMARLQCVVANLQERQISWQIRGAGYPLTVSTFSFFPDGKYIVERVGNFQWNLIIHSTRPADSGIYQCRVTTRTMLLVREVQLNVIGDLKDRDLVKKESKSQVSDIFIVVGNKVELSCNELDSAKQHDKAVLQHNFLVWFKDGYKIDSTAKSRKLITNLVSGTTAESLLSIDSATKEDEGLYMCISADKTLSMFKVHVTNSSGVTQVQPTPQQTQNIRQEPSEFKSSYAQSLNVSPVTLLFIVFHKHF